MNESLKMEPENNVQKELKREEYLNDLATNKIKYTPNILSNRRATQVETLNYSNE